MPTARKAEMLEEIRDRLQRATITIAIDYRGLSVAQLTKLRRVLREGDCEVKVVKNRIAFLAADAAGVPQVKEIVQGPSALTIGFSDAVAAARMLTRHIETERLNIQVYGGYLDGQVLTATQVQEIARLPSREQLIANVVGTLQSPLYNFSGLLQSTIRGFYGLVEARAAQLES
jgi:large subunit ribosomal protein L10